MFYVKGIIAMVAIAALCCPGNWQVIRDQLQHWLRGVSWTAYTTCSFISSASSSCFVLSSSCSFCGRVVHHVTATVFFSHIFLRLLLFLLSTGSLLIFFLSFFLSFFLLMLLSVVVMVTLLSQFSFVPFLHASSPLSNLF